MKNEIWKPVVGFEGFYEVSNFGRVRSVDRVVYFKNNKGKREYKGQILKQKYHNGYAMVNLNKNKNLSVLYVHVLVAKAFVPNPDGFKIINHKSGIKTDNRAVNLEWCTSAHNNKHAHKNGLSKSNMAGVERTNAENKVRVSCYKNEELLTTQDCSRSMAKFLIERGIVETQSIETVARQIRNCSQNGKLYYGLRFVRHNEPKHNYKESGTIDIIKNGIILSTQETSRNCAKWMLHNHLIDNASETTIARSIRKAIEQNKPYHNYIFQKNNNF